MPARTRHLRDDARARLAPLARKVYMESMSARAGAGFGEDLTGRGHDAATVLRACLGALSVRRRPAI